MQRRKVAGRTTVRHRGDEPITTASSRLDEPRRRRVVLEYPPQIPHVGPQEVGLHVDPRPHRLEELLWRDEAPRIHHEVPKHLERARPEPDFLLTSIEGPLAEREPEPLEVPGQR